MDSTSLGNPLLTNNVNIHRVCSGEMSFKETQIVLERSFEDSSVEQIREALVLSNGNLLAVAIEKKTLDVDLFQFLTLWAVKSRCLKDIFTRGLLKGDTRVLDSIRSSDLDKEIKSDLDVFYRKYKEFFDKIVDISSLDKLIENDPLDKENPLIRKDGLSIYKLCAGESRESLSCLSLEPLFEKATETQVKRVLVGKHGSLLITAIKNHRENLKLELVKFLIEQAKKAGCLNQLISYDSDEGKNIVEFAASLEVPEECYNFLEKIRRLDILPKRDILLLLTTAAEGPVPADWLDVAGVAGKLGVNKEKASEAIRDFMEAYDIYNNTYNGEELEGEFPVRDGWKSGEEGHGKRYVNPNILHWIEKVVGSKKVLIPDDWLSMVELSKEINIPIPLIRSREKKIRGFYDPDKKTYKGKAWKREYPFKKGCKEGAKPALHFNPKYLNWFMKEVDISADFVPDDWLDIKALIPIIKKSDNYIRAKMKEILKDYDPDKKTYKGVKWEGEFPIKVGRKLNGKSYVSSNLNPACVDWFKKESRLADFVPDDWLGIKKLAPIMKRSVPWVRLKISEVLEHYDSDNKTYRGESWVGEPLFKEGRKAGARGGEGFYFNPARLDWLEEEIEVLKLERKKKKCDIPRNVKGKLQKAGVRPKISKQEPQQPAKNDLKLCS